MGGDLKVRSVMAQGSVFSLEIPVNAVTPSCVEVTPDVEAAGVCAPLRVLVVDDHPTNRLILEAFMGSRGHSAICAENGAVALELASLEAFDLILMDMNMPVMDGLEATRRLRAAPGPNQDTRIAMLSASARKEDHEAGLAAGAV